MLDQLRFEISVPGGESWEMSVLPPDRFNPPTDPVGSTIIPIDGKNWWKLIRVERAVYDRIINVPVTLTGKVAANVFFEGETASIPVSSEANNVSGIGRCSSILADDGRGREMLKILCESPSRLPLATRVALVHPKSAPLRDRYLGDGGNFLSYPALTWLSPLTRRQTFFHLREELEQDSTWLAPRQGISDAKVQLAPMGLDRCTIVSYELREIVLREFLARRPRP